MGHDDVQQFGEVTGEESLQNKELEAAIRARVKDGKITCPEMFAIAEKFGLPRKQVGDAANGLKIKIHNCQLGCF
jgi:hypothetical protein